MKGLSNTIGRMLELLGVGILIIALIAIFRPQEGQSGSDALQSPVKTPTRIQPAITPLPTPRPPTIQPRVSPMLGQRTPTPQLSDFGTPPMILAPSVTPFPVSQVIDLVPQLSENDKARVYVRRSDGTYMVFLMRFEMDIKDLPLSPGDVVVQKIPPPSLMGQQPPRTTFPAPTPTVPPYPAPAK